MTPSKFQRAGWRRAAVVAAWALAAVGRAAPAWIPQPAHVDYGPGWFTLQSGVSIVVPAAAPVALEETADLARDELRLRFGVTAVVARGAAPDDGAIVLALEAAAGAADEAYTLRIGRDVEIRAAGRRGLVWGVQTMLQSVEPHDGALALRRGAIVDRPARPWRALLLDPARSFLTVDFLRHTIRVMSAYKLNVLHLHLIDDQGWRFPFEAYPKVNPPGEPCYSREDLRGLVACAARYGVEIVPEFDFPGHSRAAIAAYPELDCDGRVRGVDDSILCCGKPFTWQFIEAVVAESAAIFPSPYLHLGADEPFALRRWGDCAVCRERMKEKGVTTLPALYHTFVLDMDAIARCHGKRMIVWNDAFQADVAPVPTQDIVIDAWRTFANADAFARAGYTLINSTTGALYLSSYGLRGGLPLATVRAWNATRFADPDPKLGAATVTFRPLAPDANLLGGQASAWGTEQGLIERRLYPRLLSIADSLWAENSAGDLAAFEARLHPAHDRLLQLLGVNSDDAQPAESLFDGRDTASWVAGGAPAFAIEQGELVAPAGPACGWLRSKAAYQDFILTFEQWSPTVRDPTGIFLGCNPAGAPGAAPDGHEVSAAAPPGSLPTRSLHRASTWNHYELVARGRILTLTINGRLAWSVPRPTSGAGAIGLAGGDGVRFRAIELRRLPAENLP